VIGAMKSPNSMGSAYVFLHHVMGDIDEHGSWFYVQGGMGTVSKYIAKNAIRRGTTILVNSPVEEFIFNNGQISGVKVNGREITSKAVVTNCTPDITYFKIMSQSQRSRYLDQVTVSKLSGLDYTSPVCKINLIVSKLPMFKCLSHLHNNDPPTNEKIARDYLTGTIHMNSESMQQIEVAYNEALEGVPSKHPIIEMTIPSILDKSIVPEGSGHHVIGLFTQYAPNKLKNGQWDEETKRAYVQTIYRDIDQYCPGFSDTVLFDDILSPQDLEKEFALTGGNIFHGTLDINTLYFCRPILGMSSYESKIKNLFSCSSGMHPGGGVMGAVGRNCANVVLKKV
jgi:phytoene dehydrogenase-like protein